MRAAALIIGVLLIASATGASTGAPLVSVWYRGSPAGTPRQQDLEAIRARGFAGVTWPSRQTAGTAEVARLAADLGLVVTLRIDPVPLTAAAARVPGEVVDVVVAGSRVIDFPVLIWRAVAHGARVISFDPGAASGTGLDGAEGRPRPWVQPALAVAAELRGQASLLSEWRSSGRVVFDGPAAGALDLQLLEDNRSWILVVTNASRARERAVARLPAVVPAALWVNLRDGSLLSMISQPAGPRWSLDLEPGAARVYVVNK